VSSSDGEAVRVARDSGAATWRVDRLEPPRPSPRDAGRMTATILDHGSAGELGAVGWAHVSCSQRGEIIEIVRSAWTGARWAHTRDDQARSTTPRPRPPPRAGRWAPLELRVGHVTQLLDEVVAWADALEPVRAW